MAYCELFLIPYNLQWTGIEKKETRREERRACKEGLGHEKEDEDIGELEWNQVNIE